MTNGQKSKLPCPLDDFGRKVFSQNDEDGIIEAITSHIEMPHYFVEFGVQHGESNCLALRAAGWDGLLVDAACGGSNGIVREFVTTANVNVLLDKYGVPQDFGVLSIDIDGQDIWVWRAITRSPALVVIEYNGLLPSDQSIAIPQYDNWQWDGTDYIGASLLAMNRVGIRKNYILVYANGLNAFFVRRDLIENVDDFRYENLFRPLTFIDLVNDRWKRKYVTID